MKRRVDELTANGMALEKELIESDSELSALRWKTARFSAAYDELVSAYEADPPNDDIDNVDRIGKAWKGCADARRDLEKASLFIGRRSE